MQNRREVFAKGLSPLYLPKYQILCENLSDIWQPYYGLRSIFDQDRLFAEGRTTSGSIVTDARGGESAHNYGCASDWTPWSPDGKPIWLSAKDLKWQEYRDAITKAGLYWGGDFPGHFKDIDHNELHLSLSWSKIYDTFKSNGYSNAIEAIEKAII